MASKNEQKIQEIVDAMAVPGIISTGAGNKITGDQIASKIREIPKRTGVVVTNSGTRRSFNAYQGYYPFNTYKDVIKYTGVSSVRPTTSAVILSTNDKLCTTDIRVDGDANLIPANIKNGVSIFGVSGTYSGSSIRTMRGTFKSTARNFIFSATNYDQHMNQIDFINISNETLTYSGIILDSIVVFTNISGINPPYYNNGLILLNSSAQTAPRIFYFRVVSDFTIET